MKSPRTLKALSSERAGRMKRKQWGCQNRNLSKRAPRGCGSDHTRRGYSLVVAQKAKLTLTLPRELGPAAAAASEG